jgi:hypothetical protein
MPDFLYSFLQRATTTGARSTVLTDLRWFLGLVISGLLIAWHIQSPSWLLALFGVVLGLAVLIYFCAFIYFGITNPDALRSERFSLSKLAIERSITGDSVKGFLDPVTENARQLPAPDESPGKEHD